MRTEILAGLIAVIGLSVLCGAVSAAGMGEFVDVSGASFVGNGISFMSDAALSSGAGLYSFSGSGIGGDVSSFFSSHSMAPGLDFSFSESSSASGVVNQFFVSYSWSG